MSIFGNVIISISKPCGEIIHKGKCRFINSYDEFFDSAKRTGAHGRDYKSKIIENPTWSDAVICCDEMIDTTGDLHHRYFEDVKIQEDTPEEGVTYIDFVMGS